MAASLSYIGFLIADTLDRAIGTTLLPWWGWAFLAVALIGFLGYRDIALSAKVLTTLLVAETLAVVILDIGIIASGGESGLDLSPFNPANLGEGAVGLGIMFAFLGFIGFEATAVFRSEARNPDRTIPRATYIAVVVIGIFYALSAWAVVIGAGSENAVSQASADPVGFVPGLATRYVSPILNDVISVLMITSFIAAALTFHNVITRYAYTLGSTGLLPKRLSSIHVGHKSPAFSSLLFSFLEAAIVIIGLASTLDPILELYTWMSGAAMLGLVSLMVLTSVAVVVFFRRRVPQANLWRTLVFPVLAALSLSAILTTLIVNYELMVGSTTAAIIIEAIMFASFVAGIVVAVVYRTRRPVAYERLTAATELAPAEAEQVITW